MKTIRVSKEQLKRVQRLNASTAQLQLNAVLHAVQDGIRIMDKNLTIQVQNERARRLGKGMEERKTPCYQILHHLDVPCDNCQAIEAMDTKSW